MLLSEYLVAWQRSKEERVLDEKARINPSKSALLQIANRLDCISPREAGKLRTIIAKLEDFQNA